MYTELSSPERRRSGETQRLVVVSNRVPALSAGTAEGTETSGPVGGLVSALHPAMKEHGGVWFGWSGRSTQRRPSQIPAITQIGPVQVATVDLSEDDVSLYYTGFSNRTLWPLLHSFQERVQIRRDAYRAYRRINQRFAEALYQMLDPNDLVWVHDYHLFHVGESLRQLGWRGRTGFFLHVPFPPVETFTILPWADQILEGLLHYDVVGVHTERYLHNLIDTLDSELGGKMVDGAYLHNDMSTQLGVYHIGIETAWFDQPAPTIGRSLAERLSMPTSPEHRIILGVDRMDYTKGIPERLGAFERLLEARSSSAREGDPGPDLGTVSDEGARVHPREGASGAPRGSDQRPILRGGMGAHPLPLPFVPPIGPGPPVSRCRRLYGDSPEGRHESRCQRVRGVPGR